VALQKNFSRFIEVLGPALRHQYLPTLQQLQSEQMPGDWRFRRVIAVQLGHLCRLYDPDIFKMHLGGVCLALIKDKVAAVSIVAERSVGAIVSTFARSNSTELASNLLAEIKVALCELINGNFMTRGCMSLIRICHHAALASNGAIIADILLPFLLEFRFHEHSASGVRMTLARFFSVVTKEHLQSEDTLMKKCEAVMRVLRVDTDEETHFFASLEGEGLEPRIREDMCDTL